MGALAEDAERRPGEALRASAVSRSFEGVKLQNVKDKIVEQICSLTGGGFEVFCQGQTDISDASRPIEEDEVAACEEGGVEFTELQVATDALTVVTSADNDWLDCLTVDELNTMWAPEAEGKVTTWSQVNPEFPARNDTRRVFWKFNYNINASHRVMHGYHDDYYWIPAVPSAFTAPTTLGPMAVEARTAGEPGLLLAADQALGPSVTASANKQFAVTGLVPGTRYYWKIVGRTMANMTAESPLWSFTTEGVAPPAGVRSDHRDDARVPPLVTEETKAPSRSRTRYPARRSRSPGDLAPA